MSQQTGVSQSACPPAFGLLMILVLSALLAACAPAAQMASTPAAAQPTQAAEQVPAPSAAVSFAKDVRPILDKNCVKCHGTAGGLSVKDYDSLMKGGKDGAVIVPGDPTNSELVKLIAAGRMPQSGEKLPQSEIDLISAWITAGAKND